MIGSASFLLEQPPTGRWQPHLPVLMLPARLATVQGQAAGGATRESGGHTDVLSVVQGSLAQEVCLMLDGCVGPSRPQPMLRKNYGMNYGFREQQRVQP